MFSDSPPLSAVAFLLSGNLIATTEQQGEAVALGRGERWCRVDYARDVVGQLGGSEIARSMDYIGTLGMVALERGESAMR